MTSEHSLPADYSVRALTRDDAARVTAFVNQCFIDEVGAAATGEEDVLAEWGTPGFDMPTDTRAIFAPDGSLAAMAEFWNVQTPRVRPYLFARVHRDHRDRGLGSTLLRWAEDRARSFIPDAPPEARFVLRSGTFNTNRDAQELLGAAGFEHTRTFYRMLIEMDAPPPAPVWPEGITVRALQTTDDELRTAFEVSDEVFSDHWGHLPVEYDTWLHWLNNNPHFDPSLWFLAMDGDTIAGYCFCLPRMPEDPGLGWVEELGVRRAYRRRGLGEALLQHGFGVLWQRGQRKVGLGVDASSLTNATRLYEKVGMHVSRESWHYEKELRPGVELSTQQVAAAEAAQS
jgi:mycothiol synthase